MTRILTLVLILVTAGAFAQSDTTIVTLPPDSVQILNADVPVVSITADDLDNELGSQNNLPVTFSRPQPVSLLALLGSGSAVTIRRTPW